MVALNLQNFTLFVSKVKMCINDDCLVFQPNKRGKIVSVLNLRNMENKSQPTPPPPLQKQIDNDKR